MFLFLNISGVQLPPAPQNNGLDYSIFCKTIGYKLIEVKHCH